MESEAFREAHIHICPVHKRTGLCEYGKDGGNNRKDKGLLAILTGTYNRWWREIEKQSVRRRERERITGKRCVFSTTCILDWRPS